MDEGKEHAKALLPPCWFQQEISALYSTRRPWSSQIKELTREQTTGSKTFEEEKAKAKAIKCMYFAPPPDQEMISSLVHSKVYYYPDWISAPFCGLHPNQFRHCFIGLKLFGWCIWWLLGCLHLSFPLYFGEKS